MCRHSTIAVRGYTFGRNVVRGACVVAVGVLATMAGLVALRWPVASWLPGLAHKSDVPPVLGVGVLVIPVVLLGLGARRLAEFLAVTLEARRQSRRRSEGRAPTKAVD